MVGALLLGAYPSACSESETGDGGGGGGQGTTTNTNCTPDNDLCDSAAECCSNICATDGYCGDPGTGGSTSSSGTGAGGTTCVNQGLGDSCSLPYECCGNATDSDVSCDNAGRCCKVYHSTCNANSDCCESTSCISGICDIP